MTDWEKKGVKTIEVYIAVCHRASIQKLELFKHLCVRIIFVSVLSTGYALRRDINKASALPGNVKRFCSICLFQGPWAYCRKPVCASMDPLHSSSPHSWCYCDFTRMPTTPFSYQGAQSRAEVNSSDHTR